MRRSSTIRRRNAGFGFFAVSEAEDRRQRGFGKNGKRSPSWQSAGIKKVVFDRGGYLYHDAQARWPTRLAKQAWEF